MHIRKSWLENVKAIDLFSIGVCLFATKNILSYSSVFRMSDLLDTFISAVALAIFLLLFVTDKKEKKDILCIGITVLLLLSTMIHTNVSMFMTWVTILGLKNRSFKKFINVLFYTELFWVLTICFTSLVYLMLGMDAVVFTNRITYYSFNFGFIHSNSFSVLIFNILMMWLWMNYEKLNYKYYFAALLVIGFAFYVSRTKTLLLTGLLIIIVIIISKSKLKIIDKMIRLSGKHLFWIFSIGILILANNFLLNNSIVNIINYILTDRIRLAGFASYYYGVTSVGQFIPYSTMPYDPLFRLSAFTFDNLYSTMLFNLGYIWIIIMSVGFYRLGDKAKLKDLVFICIYFLYGITEAVIINGYLSFPIFFLCYVVTDRGNKIDSTRRKIRFKLS